MSSSAPSRARLLAFLRSAEVLRADGAVLSWSNPAHPGYAYPEAAALVLSALAHHAPGAAPERARMAEHLWLERGPLGGFGRDGLEYTFDTAIVLRGLVSHALASPARERESWLGRAAELLPPLRRALASLSPFLDVARERDSHWSRASGGHLLKCLVALRAWRAVSGDGADVPVETRLVDELLALESDGRWRESPRSERCYVHAQAYALEGLLALGATDAPRSVLRRGAGFLASLQRPSGALPAWDDESAPERTDATAQAIRLWLCVDRAAFATAIARARVHLARAQAPSGGLRYEPGSADVNTWCSAFALQAETWLERGAGAPDELY